MRSYHKDVPWLVVSGMRTARPRTLVAVAVRSQRNHDGTITMAFMCLRLVRVPTPRRRPRASRRASAGSPSSTPSRARAARSDRASAAGCGGRARSARRGGRRPHSSRAERAAARKKTKNPRARQGSTVSHRATEGTSDEWGRHRRAGSGQRVDVTRTPFVGGASGRRCLKREPHHARRGVEGGRAWQLSQERRVSSRRTCSETNTAPSDATARPNGPRNVAAAAGPSVSPRSPVPASVVVVAGPPPPPRPRRPGGGSATARVRASRRRWQLCI